MDKCASPPIRILFILFSLLLIAPALILAATIDASNAIALQPGEVHNGTIDSTKDKDYYRIRITTQAKYVFYTFGGSSKTQATLYDAQYKGIEGDSFNHGDLDNFRFVAELSPGTYYLEVRGDAGYTGTYQLHVEGPGAGTTSDDHGSSPWSATPVTVGSVTQGKLEVSDDRDFFRIEIPAQARYVFYTYGATSKTQATLYDAQYKGIEGDSFNHGDLDNFRFVTELKPGTYYLEVRGDASYLGAYQLHVEGPGAGTKSDDHGSSPWSATPVSASSETEGSLEVSDDRDYFCFEASKTAKYVISTSGTSVRTVGSLYDSFYKYVTGDSYNNGEFDNFRIEEKLNPGIYYIEVEGDSGYLGPYQLKVEGPTGAAPVAECANTSNIVKETIDSSLPYERYPTPKPPQPKATKAIFITHGWNSDADAWPNLLASNICTALATLDGSTVPDVATGKKDDVTLACTEHGWDVWVIDWSSWAHTALPVPTLAYIRGGVVGRILTGPLDLEKYTHVHFIGHSAGSNLIQNIVNRVKALPDSPDIHMTFLDAFDPAIASRSAFEAFLRWFQLEYSSTYGANANWVDNYYDSEGGLSEGPTRPILSNAYNIDITKSFVATDVSLPYKIAGVDHHSWPYRFYISSVDNRDMILGYGLSLEAHEGRPMDIFIPDSARGAMCILDKGNFKTCSDVKFPAVELFEDGVKETFADAGQLAIKALSATGQVAKEVVSSCPSTLLSPINPLGSACVMITLIADSNLPIIQEKAGGKVANASSTIAPVWVEYEISPPDSANLLAFDFSFKGDAEGMLSVFVDGEKREVLDQRAWRKLPGAANGVWLGETTRNKRVLGFRLDSYGNMPASVSISNITFFERKAVTPGTDDSENQENQAPDGGENSGKETQTPTLVQGDSVDKFSSGGGGITGPLTLAFLGLLLPFFCAFRR